MIEFLKILGSALVTAAVTIYAMHVKRHWEKQDRNTESEQARDDKIDALADEVKALSEKVDKLTTGLNKVSSDLEKEVAYSDNMDHSLQAGLREILYDRIKFLCRKFVSESKIREEDYNSLQRMWSAYHNQLGGNGFLDKFMEEVETLERY